MQCISIDDNIKLKNTEKRLSQYKICGSLFLFYNK